MNIKKAGCSIRTTANIFLTLKFLTMQTIVKYTRKDHNSEWSTEYHSIPFKTVPLRAERNDLDIHYWLEQFPILTPPNREPDFTESRGNSWTEHFLEYYYI